MKSLRSLLSAEEVQPGHGAGRVLVRADPGVDGAEHLRELVSPERLLVHGRAQTLCTPSIVPLAWWRCPSHRMAVHKKRGESSAPSVTQKWLLSCSVRETGLAWGASPPKQAREKKSRICTGSALRSTSRLVRKPHACAIKPFRSGRRRQHKQTKMEKSVLSVSRFSPVPASFRDTRRVMYKTDKKR